MTALDATGYVQTTEDGNTTILTASHSHALDVIGDIPDVSGWHVNYVGELPNGWDKYLVTPVFPIRVFAV